MGTGASDPPSPRSPRDRNRRGAQDGRACGIPEQWKSVEENFDQSEIIQPNLNVIASLKEFCLSDFYIIQKWVDYAKGIGDQSIEILNERPIVYKEIYERAKKRINV